MVIYERLYRQHQTKRNNDVAYIIDIFILDNDNAPYMVIVFEHNIRILVKTKRKRIRSMHQNKMAQLVLIKHILDILIIECNK